jgi:peptide-methionine (R)-S-oxide reductase
MYKVEKTDEEWRAQLTPSEYAVLRKAATEPAFVGEYTDTKTIGVYHCKACDAELFRSDHKFESHCGWPSFYAPTDDDAVELVPDHSYGMRRIEARCARCGSHLGHLFQGEKYGNPIDDRFCVNSVSVRLEPAE